MPPGEGWLPAVVPGTVLTSLLANGRIPDPYFGLNNKKIPDVGEVCIHPFNTSSIKVFLNAGVEITLLNLNVE